MHSQRYGRPEMRCSSSFTGEHREKRSMPMHSSMIGKIAKAKQYAQEPERIQFSQFAATFRGENDTHTTSFDNGAWNCTCRFFSDWGTCCHTMAIERVLGVMVPADQRQGEPLNLSATS
jgi:hypothetical protein